MQDDLSQPATCIGVAARAAVRLLEQRGVDPARILRQAGLTYEAVFDENRISASDQVTLLELAANELKDDWIGLTLATEVDLRETGLLYYVSASATTLAEAVQRLDRYLAVANDGLDLTVVKGEAYGVRIVYTGIPRHLDFQQAELLALYFVRLCRQLLGRSVTPLRVSFMHHREGDLSPARTAFGCLPEFGAPFDEVSLPNALLEEKVVVADPYLGEIMIKACEEAMAGRPTNVSRLRTRVENAIAPLLPHAEARSDRVARQLGISRRTLSRRLKEEGTTFDQILDGLRRDLAVRYLEDPRMPISRIAWLLGFHQPSAFSHACRRWLNQSPMAHRRQILERRAVQ